MDNAKTPDSTPLATSVAEKMRIMKLLETKEIGKPEKTRIMTVSNQ